MQPVQHVTIDASRTDACVPTHDPFDDGRAFQDRLHQGPAECATAGVFTVRIAEMR